MLATHYLCESSLFGLEYLEYCFKNTIPSWILSKTVFLDYGIIKNNEKNSFKLLTSHQCKSPFPNELFSKLRPFVTSTFDIHPEHLTIDICLPGHPFWHLYIKKYHSSFPKLNIKQAARDVMNNAFFKRQQPFLICYRRCIIGISSYLNSPKCLSVENPNLFEPFSINYDSVYQEFQKLVRKYADNRQKVEIIEACSFEDDLF